jgi:hypothetical protein
MIHDKYLHLKPFHWKPIYVVRNNIHPEEWYGSVLYLGMGRCYNPLKQSDKVTKTTIVEIDQRTIDYNVDIIKPEWNIICEDVYKFKPTEKYDFIFVDIWYEQVESEVVDNLVEQYREYLTENGQIIYLRTIKK